MTADKQAARARIGGSETGVLGQLRKKSREELLFLVEQLLERNPDIKPLIELLIELPIPNGSQQGKPSGKRKSRTLNLASIQAQIKAALRHADGGWRSANLIATELRRLCEIGDGFGEAGEWANAQAVYAAIASSAIARYEELEDECQIAEVIDECTDGLVVCLDVQRDLPGDERLSVAGREELLAVLFDTWKFERNYGGIYADVEGTIVRNVTEEERKMVEGWLQQEMGLDQENKRPNQNLVGFLTKLKEIES